MQGAGGRVDRHRRRHARSSAAASAPTYPDITGASRAMKESEYELCTANGVDNITEVLIGYDGLSIAHSIERPGPRPDQGADLPGARLRGRGRRPDRRQPLQELERDRPVAAGRADPVFGPPPTSGTRDAFVELVMHEGCRRASRRSRRSRRSTKLDEVCSRMRQDGPFIEAGENDNLIVQRLEADPNALGIFGYSFLYENRTSCKAVTVDGVSPTLRHHRRRQLPGVAAALHLRQERPPRRHPRPRRVRGRVHLRGGLRARTATSPSAA